MPMRSHVGLALLNLRILPVWRLPWRFLRTCKCPLRDRRLVLRVLKSRRLKKALSWYAYIVYFVVEYY
jgi:hypothetical protein